MVIVGIIKSLFENRCKYKMYQKLEYDEVPKWVRIAQDEWESRLGHRPYGLTKKFIGRSWVYECEFHTIGQGIVEEHWVKYLKGK